MLQFVLRVFETPSYTKLSLLAAKDMVKCVSPSSSNTVVLPIA